MRLEEAGDDAGDRLLLPRELIGRHRLDGSARHDALTPEPTLVQHHLSERDEVADGRHESARTRRERGRRAPLAVWFVGELERAGFEVGRVARRETVELVGGHAESRVVHPERFEDAFAEERVERLAGGARDEDAEELRPGVVHPPIARLIHQRERREASDPFVRRGRP